MTYEVEFVNPCDPPTVFTPPSTSTQNYDIADPTATYIVNPFTNDNVYCTSFTHATTIARQDGNTPSSAFYFGDGDGSSNS